MANLNKVMLIGRLTRDPEKIETRNGGGVKFGFAVNNRKLNQDTQQWEEVPVFIDCEMWNRGESKQADRLLQTVRKGQQIFLEGHLKLDTWEDKNGGGKRNALRVVVETFQYLDAKGEGGGSGEPRPYRPAAAASAPAARSNGSGRAPAPARSYDDDDMGSPPPSRSGSGGGGDDDIPF